MNELIELGMVAEPSGASQAGTADGDLIELGSVIQETKAHNHGTLLDASLVATTSP